MTDRKQLDALNLQDVVEHVSMMVDTRLQEKGRGAFASNHEILGVIDQETDEYRQAIHQHLGDQHKMDELTDIAVAAIIGIASIRCGGTDW